MYRLYKNCILCNSEVRIIPSRVLRRKYTRNVDKSAAELNAGYVPHEVESLGLGNGYFEPPIKSQTPFTIVLPPPNITGTLHLGHALTTTVEDVLIRWHKMRGIETVWVPGIDHAGIATQVVVEKRLWKENRQTRHDIGRRRFQEKVWEWKEEKSKVIGDQLHRLGVSLNWEKEFFTMDQRCSKAVNEAFLRLFESNLIYRDDHLVNWSCVLRSAISDIEVEHLNVDGPTNIVVPGYERPVEFGTLTKFAYKVKDSDEEIVVATTRPETMLGDVGVAVHPEDQSHARFVGRYLWHPFRDQPIPVITDEFVDPAFGTVQSLKMEAPQSLDIHHTLKCNVCDNYLNVAPVLTSEDGKINKCGRCNLKGPQLTNRNSLYESIGSKLSFPCINEKCNKRLAWQEVERHEKTCLHRKIPCPFWVCRDKELEINMLKDPGHFQTDHPGILCDKKVSVSLADIKRHPSFIKLLTVDSLPYFLIVHGVSTGERIWVGVFNFDVVQKNYQIKLFADESMRKCIIYKEPVRLYDEHKQCIYCLQNLCNIESHKYSKCHQDAQKEKFKYYTKIDVLCTKNVLLSEDLSFEVSIAPFDIAPMLNGNA